MTDQSAPSKLLELLAFIADTLTATRDVLEQKGNPQ